MFSGFRKNGLGCRRFKARGFIISFQVLREVIRVEQVSGDTVCEGGYEFPVKTGVGDLTFGVYRVEAVRWWRTFVAQAGRVEVGFKSGNDCMVGGFSAP